MINSLLVNHELMNLVLFLFTKRPLLPWYRTKEFVTLDRFLYSHQLYTYFAYTSDPIYEKISLFEDVKVSAARPVDGLT